jgi:hypothetical protein
MIHWALNECKWVHHRESFSCRCNWWRVIVMKHRLQYSTGIFLHTPRSCLLAVPLTLTTLYSMTIRFVPWTLLSTSCFRFCRHPSPHDAFEADLLWLPITDVAFRIPRRFICDFAFVPPNFRVHTMLSMQICSDCQSRTLPFVSHVDSYVTLRSFLRTFESQSCSDCQSRTLPLVCHVDSYVA